MTTNILNTLAGLKQRPGMYYSYPFDKNSLKAYLVGFITGIEVTQGVSISTQLFYWLRKKTKIDYDLVWNEIICSYYKDKTDEELKIILIETLEEFFKDNPDWDKAPPNDRIRFDPNN
ncbi:MAG: hypothetical protein ACXVPU_07340 [Bacteroidia bacterium]